MNFTGDYLVYILEYVRIGYHTATSISSCNFSLLRSFEFLHLITVSRNLTDREFFSRISFEYQCLAHVYESMIADGHRSRKENIQQSNLREINDLVDVMLFRQENRLSKKSFP
jgi:hypothetical protein